MAVVIRFCFHHLLLFEIEYVSTPKHLNNSLLAEPTPMDSGRCSQSRARRKFLEQHMVQEVAMPLVDGAGRGSAGCRDERKRDLRGSPWQTRRKR